MYRYEQTNHVWNYYDIVFVKKNHKIHYIGKFGHANSIQLKVQIFQITQQNWKHTNLPPQNNRVLLWIIYFSKSSIYYSRFKRHFYFHFVFKGNFLIDFLLDWLFVFLKKKKFSSPFLNVLNVFCVYRCLVFWI